MTCNRFCFQQYRNAEAKQQTAHAAKDAAAAVLVAARDASDALEAQATQTRFNQRVLEVFGWMLYTMKQMVGAKLLKMANRHRVLHEDEKQRAVASKLKLQSAVQIHEQISHVCIEL